MKYFKTHRRAAVSSLALVVAIFAGGAAFAFFTTTGGGSGHAYTGTGGTVSITQLTPNSQVVYDSFVNPMPSSTPSEAFSQLAVDMNGPASVGNAVTLASPGTTLSSAVVALNNWACQTGNGNGPTCVTSNPNATYPATMTFNVYDPAVSLTSPIATDTQTFAIPYRPSADAVNCGTGSSEWFDAASSTCHYGQTTTVTFNSFTGSLVLPSNVVYEIKYAPNSSSLSDPSNYLNFSLSTEPTNVSIGSDTDPGNLYMNIPVNTAAAGSSGQVTCQAQVMGFHEYSTAAGTNCGLGSTLNIPVVEIYSSASGFISLTPGGPAQPVDFSIHNTGSGPAYVQSVSFALTSSNVALCDLNWFALVQPTIPVDVTIPGGSTVIYQPSGASISLLNEPYSQNACENATLNLTFSVS